MRPSKPCTSMSEPNRRGVPVHMCCAVDRARRYASRASEVRSLRAARALGAALTCDWLISALSPNSFQHHHDSNPGADNTLVLR